MASPAQQPSHPPGPLEMSLELALRVAHLGLSLFSFLGGCWHSIIKTF